MSNSFVGEIRIFAGTFAPAGWAFCDGQTLSIAEFETLFQLIGTTYGGDGQTTFLLPDLRGRLPMHAGGNFPMVGEMGGVEQVTLTTQNIPQHNHALAATSERAAPAYAFGGGNFGDTGATPVYAAAGSGTVALASGAAAAVGQSQPHNNMAPYLCVNFIIALDGLFPVST